MFIFSPMTIIRRRQNITSLQSAKTPKRKEWKSFVGTLKIRFVVLRTRLRKISVKLGTSFLAMTTFTWKKKTSFDVPPTTKARSRRKKSRFLRTDFSVLFFLPFLRLCDGRDKDIFIYATDAGERRNNMNNNENENIIIKSKDNFEELKQRLEGV